MQGFFLSSPLTAPAAATASVASVDLGSAVGADFKVTTPATTFKPKDTVYASVTTATSDPAATVPGKLTAADLAAKIDAGGGTAVLKTLDGQDLTATKSGDAIILTSASGNKAAVTQADVGQANGIVHVIDAVLLPKM